MKSKFNTAGEIIGLLIIEFMAWFTWTLAFAVCDMGASGGLERLDYWIYGAGCILILVLSPILIEEEAK